MPQLGPTYREIDERAAAAGDAADWHTNLYRLDWRTTERPSSPREPVVLPGSARRNADDAREAELDRQEAERE